MKWIEEKSIRYFFHCVMCCYASAGSRVTCGVIVAAENNRIHFFFRKAYLSSSVQFLSNELWERFFTIARSLSVWSSFYQVFLHFMSAAALAAAATKQLFRHHFVTCAIILLFFNRSHREKGIRVEKINKRVDRTDWAGLWVHFITSHPQCLAKTVYNACIYDVKIYIYFGAMFVSLLKNLKYQRRIIRW